VGAETTSGGSPRHGPAHQANWELNAGLGEAVDTEEHQAGIVDEDVQASESLNGLLCGRLGLVAVGDVRLHDQRGAARLVDLGRECLQTVPATGHERDGGTFLGEPAGGGSADAAACTGDKGHGTGQSRRHGSLSFSLGNRMAVDVKASPRCVRPSPATHRRM